MRVGVDIDGVMYDFQLAFQAWLEMRGDKGPFPPANKWEFYEEWGLNTAEFITICHSAANNMHLFDYGPPMDDAAYHLGRIRDHGHQIVLITDRSFGENDVSQHMTKAWLSRHCIPWDEIHFTADKSKIQVDFMIDDKPQNYHEMIAAGVDSWLRRRPWNESTVIECRYVDSLHEYVNYVLQTAERIPAVAANLGPNFHRELAGITAFEEVRTTSETGGQKGDKLARFDLIPVDGLWELAELYGQGAKKYAPRNWELGYDWSKSYAALQRHANLFWAGESYDMHKESCADDCTTHTQRHHLASVMFHCMALMEWERTHPEFDDRPQS